MAGSRENRRDGVGAENRAMNPTGRWEQSNTSGREERAEQDVRQRKGIGVAPREGLELLCGMPVKKIAPSALKYKTSDIEDIAYKYINDRNECCFLISVDKDQT